MRIPVGTKVAWVSGAWGIDRRKEGVVVAFVPARVSVSSCLPTKVPKSRLHGQDVSAKDRYLVEVRFGPHRQPVYYTPLASVLERAWGTAHGAEVVR